ncbi:MAG: DUF1127 domain-containing protein [Pseudomonadota bacterium]
MNAITQRTAPFGAITVHNIVSALYALRTRFEDRLAARRTAAQLRALTVAQLDDIGLTPGDIDDIAAGRL